MTPSLSIEAVRALAAKWRAEATRLDAYKNHIRADAFANAADELESLLSHAGGSAPPACDEEIGFRRLLWLRHGCNVYALYGDDGEMQCNFCGLDFKRDSASRIEDFFRTRIGWREPAPSQEPPR